ncbi:MAG: hypothetical protein WC445_03490 [Patescibacteria group bacterium]
MSTHRKKPKKRTARTPLAGDLLHPETLKDLLAQQAEERRLAEEAEDTYYDAFSAEVEAHPIGHPGHTPHGCT